MYRKAIVASEIIMLYATVFFFITYCILVSLMFMDMFIVYRYHILTLRRPCTYIQINILNCVMCIDVK